VFFDFRRDGRVGQEIILPVSMGFNDCFRPFPQRHQPDVGVERYRFVGQYKRDVNIAILGMRSFGVLTENTCVQHFNIVPADFFQKLPTQVYSIIFIHVLMVVILSIHSTAYSRVQPCKGNYCNGKKQIIQKKYTHPLKSSLHWV
jgi:hypothetical protein